jgi:hypothetical protein
MEEEIVKLMQSINKHTAPEENIKKAMRANRDFEYLSGVFDALTANKDIIQEKLSRMKELYPMEKSHD